MCWCLTTEVSEQFLSWTFILLLIQEHLLLTEWNWKKWRRWSCLFLTVQSQSLNFERILLNVCHLVATSGNIMSSWPDNPDRVWRFFWGANWTWFDHWCSLHLQLGQSTQWKQSGDHLGTLSRYWVSKETCTLQCSRYNFRSALHSPFLSVHLKIIVCSFCNLVTFYCPLLTCLM